MTPQSRRNLLAAVVVVYGLLMTGIGLEIGDDSPLGDIGSLIASVIFLGWLGAPFIPIALLILNGYKGRKALAAGLVVATIGTLSVPTIMQRSVVEGDPSSTAAVAHVLDPLVSLVAVGVVLAIGQLGRTLQLRRERLAQAREM